MRFEPASDLSAGKVREGSGTIIISARPLALAVLFNKCDYNFAP